MRCGKTSYCLVNREAQRTALDQWMDPLWDQGLIATTLKAANIYQCCIYMSWGTLVQWAPSYLPINNIPIWAHYTQSKVTRMTTYKTEVIKGQSLTLASIGIEFMEAAKATQWQLMAWCPLAPGHQLLQSWLLWGATCGPWNQDSVDPSHKSHNAPDEYPTMHHFVTEMCISVTKWHILGYGTAAFWDLCNHRSILKNTTVQPEILSSITLLCRIQKNYHVLPISSVLPNVSAHIYKHDRCHVFFLLLLIKESCWTTFNYLPDNITI